MLSLKLAKLPERKPVKYSLTINAELASLLEDYAVLYQKAYGGEPERIEELIPYMLNSFLNADRVFLKERQALRIELSS